EQELPAAVKLTSDVLYSKRDTSIFASQVGTGYSSQQTSEDQYFGNVAVARNISDSVEASLIASYSRLRENEAIQSSYLGTLSVGSVVPTSSSLEIKAKVDGDVARIPTGIVKFTAGGGYSKDT